MRTVPIAALLLLLAAVAPAAELVLAPVAAGDDARLACEGDLDFLAGTSSTAAQLQVGGTAYGCDREWAASCEFDLGPVPADLDLLSAVFTVRKTGYADDAQGLFYLGLFTYPASGAPTAVPRDDLDPQTALGVVWLTAVNGDLSFDVTEPVERVLGDPGARLGLLLAGVYSEAGYEDWITIGGAAHAQPPRLTLTYAGAVGNEPRTWSEVKALYR
ncbi:MAG TPA: hypothetical protein P5571_09645 [Candidatus Krumholzibacteria bacterium]|nr:hypothetical protein [Candidatus Krumholzibacteria bacterium]HRX51615.1 hypothetical protein [Candidatus Krumholzibacteria bacterium]